MAGLYQSLLGLAKPSFRLLILHPAANYADPILCNLAVFPLQADEHPEYEALSYCWGDEANPGFLTCNGEKFPIRDNLNAGLRRLRLSDHTRILWVDAICINQLDLLEREQQVDFMRDIYRGSAQTLVWLGDSDRDSTSPVDDSQLAFPMIERLVRFRIHILMSGDVDITSPSFISSFILSPDEQEKMR
jgi:hypothetical protein